MQTITKIKNLIKYYLPKNRIEVIAMVLSIFFFMFLFLIVTPIIQKYAIENMPSSYYLTISEPVSVDKEVYSQGESVVLTVNQSSKVTSDSYTVRELILYDTDGREIVLKSDNIVGIVKQGERSIVIIFDLPSDLKDNKYYIRGILVFHVRGIEKSVEWISSSFEVK